MLLSVFILNGNSVLELAVCVDLNRWWEGAEEMPRRVVQEVGRRFLVGSKAEVSDLLQW